MSGLRDLDFGGWRVHIDRSFAAFDTVGIWLVRRQVIQGRPSTEVALPVDLTMEPHDEAEALPSRPTLRLPAEAGRALLDQLAGYYGGTGEVVSLRRDYDAERARVDKLIDHLIRGGLG